MTAHLSALAEIATTPSLTVRDCRRIAEGAMFGTDRASARAFRVRETREQRQRRLFPWASTQPLPRGPRPLREVETP